jgi:hypothetical protein
MAPLITVILAVATSLLTLAIAIMTKDLFPGHHWLLYVLLSLSGALYLLAIFLGVSHWRGERLKLQEAKHEEITIRLAALMKQGADIYACLKSASDDSKYTELISKAADWENGIVALLKEAKLATDAEHFSQVGHTELSSEWLAPFAHVPEWKRPVIARFALHRQTLDQIRSNRRL